MGKLIESQGYQGNFSEDSSFVFWFTSCDKDGASVAITTIGTITARRGVTSAVAPSGVTITQDADSRTGCHRVSVDLSADAFFTTDNDYSLFLTGTTVDSESLNPVLCTFSIEKRLD
jgi:hypothetical protein